MKNILVDAGPLIALFDKDDRYHSITLKFLKDFHGNLITTWPVITEVMYMLNFSINAQTDFLEWIRMDAVSIYPLEKQHLQRIIELSQKYSDIPMDLADCSLIVIAELTGIYDILSIDSDYNIYRTKSKRQLNNLLKPYMKKNY
jgi:hypothetical protein